MVTLFVISFFLIFWAYFGYPLSMYLLANYFPYHHIYKDDYEPTISVIIAVANGVRKIYKKLDNLMGTNYPISKMEVIIVLDGESKETENNIDIFLRTYPQYKDVIQIVTIKKGGKETAQLKGVTMAKHDICVFTDVDTVFEPDTLHALTCNFSNENIGSVDGMSRIVSNGHSNEGLYLKYENKIRDWESLTSSGLVTLGGCLFAARRSLLMNHTTIYGKTYDGFVNNLQSDFRTALVTKTFGKHAMLEPLAVAEFADGQESKEFGRKHRTIVRGINNLFHNLHLLNPFKYGLFSYALFCHKLLKWLVPFFMIGAFISSLVLSLESNFWLIVWLIQFFTYQLITISLENKYVKIIKFLVISNAAILKAWYSYLVKGERFVSWEPTKR